LSSAQRLHDARVGPASGTQVLLARDGCFFDRGKIMEWLSQNWIWLAFAAAMVLMMRRGGAGGCCGGGGHDRNDKQDEAVGAQTKNAAAGSCCGGGGHSAEDKRPEAESAHSAAVPAGHQH